MKALVLAGGFAKRMWPLTNDRPKSLLPIRGKPLLEYVLKKLEPLDIDQIYISTNSRFEKEFALFLQTYRSSKLIKLVVEPSNSEDHKFGAVKGIEFAIDQEKIAEPLIVINGDNLFDAGLFGLLVNYKKHKSPVVGLYDVKSLGLAKNLGVAETNAEGRIISFIEKPEHPKSSLISTGIYIFTVPAIQKIPEYLRSNHGDRSGDFIKWLSEKTPVFSWIVPGKWYDIGSHQEYERAEKEWE